MKKPAIALIITLLMCISLSSKADGFSIRNGIKWGMSFDEVIERIQADHLTIKAKNHSDQSFAILCSDVLVANKKMEMLIIGDSENGLYLITYYHPDYSIRSSKQMIKDFDSFRDSIMLKYGKPSADYSEWGDDAFKGIYEEHTAANLGFFTKHAYWKTNDCFIDLCLNSDLKELDSNLPGPTVWIGYYPPEFAEMIINMRPSTEGL